MITLQDKIASHRKLILSDLLTGDRITEFKSVTKWGRWKVSTRVGELVKMGVPIKRRTVPGAHHKEYWIEIKNITPDQWGVINGILEC